MTVPVIGSKKKKTINDAAWFDVAVAKIAKFLLKNTHHIDGTGLASGMPQTIDKQFYANLRQILKCIAVDGEIPMEAQLAGRVREHCMTMAREMDLLVAEALSGKNYCNREIKRNHVNGYNLQSRIILIDTNLIPGLHHIVPPELLREMKTNVDNVDNVERKENGSND